MMSLRPAQARINEQKDSSEIMTIKNIAATLGAAALILAAPAIASADTTAAPVQLNHVQITPSQNQSSEYDPGTVAVAFTNEKAVPATDIEFALQSNDGKILDTFDANGSFAEGTLVRQNFADINLDQNQQLTIVRATFADGSTWTNDSVSYLPEAPQTDFVAGVSGYAPEY